MVPPVFKTEEVEQLGLAGSIPVRLRHPVPEAGSIPVRLRHTVPEAGSIPVRLRHPLPGARATHRVW
ncbi:hypothetical protein BN12_3580002 [Nostocoides japonicum T1-X7]|uniref:Uncharacterized protein n=1 Tax=Nostocoides japonicum T1-X7 TaxID=1194083 RepID=A0A077M191_9MICO|nr:hypothetical protein BN12_3580002 [Tetrasphaera japonica T1-X7]